jgi:hypothetical protein
MFTLCEAQPLINNIGTLQIIMMFRFIVNSSVLYNHFHSGGEEQSRKKREGGQRK